MKKFGIIAAMLVVVAMMVAIPMVAMADGQQHWKLDSQNTNAGVTCPVYSMYRVEGPGGGGAPSGTVTIGKAPAGTGITETCATWLACEPADCAGGVTFSGGNWIISLKTPAQPDWSTSLHAYIGSYDTDTCTFTAFQTNPVINFGYIGGILRAEAMIAPGTVPDGDYLALQLCNTDKANTHSIIMDGSASELTSPDVDPGYPFPEVAAGVLFGMGFIGLVGYLGIKWLKGKRQTVV